jgi:hypothetical protein
MDKDIFKIIAIVGFACSMIAGMMAFVITFNEYSHHFAEKRDAVKQSLEAGVVTFLFFVILTVAIGFFMTYLI